MRSCILSLVLCLSGSLWAQNPGPADRQKSKTSDADTPQSTTQRAPNLEAPRSDRVNVNDLGDVDGQSSSKETQIDLSPPADDAKTHPKSSEILTEEGSVESGDVAEFHPWDPHKAAKDIEVGDFYFKRKNYRAAEDRYREALYYKENDAIATYRLGECLEKMDRRDEARTQFENYLKILPNGPQADDSRRAIERLKTGGTGAKAAK